MNPLQVDNRMQAMNIFESECWKSNIDMTKPGYKSGLRLHFDKNVDSDVRECCLDFARWLRKRYRFPIRLNIYIKGSYRIRAVDGEMVVGTMWRPEDYNSFPYMRMATGDYEDLKDERGEDGALWAILQTFAHELTHYYQHINNLSLTPVGEERQARAYSYKVLSEYADFIDTEQSFCPQDL